MPREPITWGLWRFRGGATSGYWGSPANLRIVNPTISTSNRFLVGVQIMVTDVIAAIIAGGGTLSAYLESVILADAVAE
jgi:hypothetical protein